MINPLKIGEMLSQANQMQEEVQRKLAQTVVEGTSGGGAVTATMNGKKQLLKIRIEPAAVVGLGGLFGFLLVWLLPSTVYSSPRSHKISAPPE